MKRLYILLTFFCLVSIMNGHVKTIQLKYDVNDFNYVQFEGASYITSGKVDVFFKSIPNAPALPYTMVNVLIGPDEELMDYSYSAKKTLVRSSFLLGYNPIAVPTDGSIQATNMPVERIKYDKEVYPSLDIVYKGTHEIDGYRYLSFSVSPFRYEPASKTLYIHQELTLDISISKSRQNKENPVVGHNMRNAVKKYVINEEDLDFLYAQKQTRTDIIASIANTEDYEYLIVTSNALKNTFEQLATWKTKRGVRTKVITTEFIYANYSAQELTTPSNNAQYTNNKHSLQIKKALKDYYENHNVKYVLLGGDVSIVPSPICFYNGPNLMQRTVPSDYYYVSLTDIIWDLDGDGINNGLIESNLLSYDPHLIVSRLSVNNATDTENYIERLIDYEQNGFSESTDFNILMCGSQLYYTHQGMSDAQYIADSVFQTFIAPYSSINRYQFFDTYKSPSYASCGLTVSDLQTIFEDSHHFIDINMHGSRQAIKFVNDYYTTTYANNFENPISSFITTAACNTNNFEDPTNPCLSEMWMRNPNSGLLGYLGCSAEGWTYQVPYILGSSERYNGEFYKLLFSNAYTHFGELALHAKELFLNNDTLSEAQWLLLGINPLGDPEMNVNPSTGVAEFTMNSASSQRIIINYANRVLNVQAPLSDCRITVFSTADNGQTYFATADHTTNATFEPPLVECTISVTCPEYRPFFTNINSPIYVQNQTISTNTTIIGESVYVGRNVTEAQPYGSVKIQNGTTNIRAGKEVLLKNDFEVTLGASFNISIEN